MAKPPRSVWCVKSRGDLWCATADGKLHSEEAASVATKCGYFVILPIGASKRRPTCRECLQVQEGGGNG